MEEEKASVSSVWSKRLLQRNGKKEDKWLDCKYIDKSRGVGLLCEF